MPATTGAKQKPMLDENSFQQLLAAAYVVQQHNDSLWIKSPQLDTARVLSEISEMQAISQADQVDVHVAGKLITERLLKMLAATGVSLSLISNGYLDCVAESGVAAKVPGSSLASHSLVATERLKAGEMFESRDARQDMRLDINLCLALTVGSLIAAPVLRFGELSGLIEVRWARPQAFDDPGLLACRLMASLVTELLQRQTMQAEQLSTNAAQPAAASPPPPAQIAKAEASAAQAQTATEEAANRTSELNDKRDVKNGQGNHTDIVSKDIPEIVVSEKSKTAKDAVVAQDQLGIQKEAPKVAEQNVAAPADRCRVCGRPFGADEAFCGFCSMPRAVVNPSRELQSKWASLWFIQQAQGTLKETEDTTVAAAPESVAPQVSNAAEGAVTQAVATTVAVDNLSERPSPAKDTKPATPQAPDEIKDHFTYFEPAPSERDIASEREFWEIAAAAAHSSKSLLQRVRAKDLVLTAVALVLAFGVVSAWPSSNGRLTWFGSLVVRMGLARHSVPSYAGNPSVNVWIDEQTSQYFCPGEERYGNTSAGHYSTQLEAEQAQLQPASGLVCQ